MISLDNNLTLGYLKSMTILVQAASALGRRSAEVRIQKWGKQEFLRRMREWGKLGGAPRKLKKGESK
jgi:hypothetical protein